MKKIGQDEAFLCLSQVRCRFSGYLQKEVSTLSPGIILKLYKKGGTRLKVCLIPEK